MRWKCVLLTHIIPVFQQRKKILRKKILIFLPLLNKITVILPFFKQHFISYGSFLFKLILIHLTDRVKTAKSYKPALTAALHFSFMYEAKTKTKKYV